MIYTFSDDARRFYEALPVPLAFFQDVEGQAVALLVTDGLCELMGAPRDELTALLNDSLLERVHPDDVGRLTAMVDRFAHYQSGYDVVYRGKYGRDSEYRYIHSVARWMWMPDGTELGVFSYTDISNSAAESNRLMESYALMERDRFYSDAVTGLPNINFLHEFGNDKVNRLWSEGETPAAIYFDVNGLRSYNNQYGYAQGDSLLMLIAEILQQSFERGLVTRGADDHFIVVAGIEGERQLAEKIRAINENIQQRASGNTRGVQAGVCVFEEGMAAATALDHARHALKQIADDLSLSCCFYNRDSEDNYLAQRYILENFDRALESGWIRVYYQAITRLETGKACATEALARWIDPARGVISPGQFIPVLERYHLLHRLDLYMVEQICREFNVRKKAGMPLVPVSVNFCGQDFDHVSVVSSLNAILEKYGVSRELIIVEITEQDMATGTEQFRRQLSELRQNGYNLWLDDFGSGYSSLNVLSQFEIDLVKFDMELLMNLDTRNGANRHIMRTMVALCRELGIHTLSEGMEDADQRAFLKEIDCELAQGFYFYRPQPIEAMLARLENGGPHIPCETPEERERCNREWLMGRAEER